MRPAAQGVVPDPAAMQLNLRQADNVARQREQDRQAANQIGARRNRNRNEAGAAETSREIQAREQTRRAQQGQLSAVTGEPIVRQINMYNPPPGFQAERANSSGGSPSREISMSRSDFGSPEADSPAQRGVVYDENAFMLPQQPDENIGPQNTAQMFNRYRERGPGADPSVREGEGERFASAAAANAEYRRIHGPQMAKDLLKKGPGK